MPLRLVRYPARSPHFYLRGTVRKRYIFETTGTDNPQTAEDIRIKRENDLLNSSVFGVGATVKFEEAAASYLTNGGQARFLGTWDHAKRRGTLLLGHFYSTPLNNIGQDEADEAARVLYAGATSATIKRQLYIPLCAVLNHAAKRKWCQRPYIKHPRVPEPQTTWSSPERLAKLLAHCAPQMRLFLVIGAYTGARLSEILRVDWDEDVNLVQRQIIFRRTKTGKMRTAHIPDPLLIELSSVAPERRHGRVFDWTNKISVYVPLKNACKRAGVPYLAPHQQGRHTYATWLRQYAGLDLMGLKEAGGWARVSSVERYAHVAPGESARATDRLPSVQNPCTDETKTGKVLKQKLK